MFQQNPMILVSLIAICCSFFSCESQKMTKQTYEEGILSDALMVDSTLLYKNESDKEVKEYTAFYFDPFHSLRYTDTLRIIDPLTYTEEVIVEQKVRVLQKGDVDESITIDNGIILDYLEEGDSTKIYRVMIPDFNN